MPTSDNPNAGTGILSVWNDYAPDREADYERWYMTEHFPERLAVPGFRRGRRYRAIDADRAWFTFYDLDTPEVLFSAAYLARQNAPTPWTTRIMSGWSGMLRTVCRRVARDGSAIGGYAAVARWEGDAPTSATLAREIRGRATDPAIIAVDHWLAFERQNVPTIEQAARPSPDRTITAAVLVEATTVAAAERAAAGFSALLGGEPRPSAIGVYALVATQDA